MPHTPVIQWKYRIIGQWERGNHLNNVIFQLIQLPGIVLSFRKCTQMNATSSRRWYFKIRSGNGSVPPDDKPSPKPIPVCAAIWPHQESMTLKSGTFYNKRTRYWQRHNQIMISLVLLPPLIVNPALPWQCGYICIQKSGVQLPLLLEVHYSDVIIGARESQITSLTIVYPTVYSDADQRKHQSSASLAFVRGIHRWPVNSPHNGPVKQKIFPFDDVIMCWNATFIPRSRLKEWTCQLPSASPF